MKTEEDRKGTYPVRFTREIPPVVTKSIEGAFSSESEAIEPVEHHPLLLAIFFWPAIWSLWGHHKSIHLQIQIQIEIEMLIDETKRKRAGR